MSQENVEAIHRGVDAMNRGELDTILDLVDDEILWEPLRASVEGSYRGHAGMRRYWVDTAESFELFEVRFAELRDLGDRVLAIGTVRARGRDSGAEIEIATAAVFTFREGRLVHYKDYGDRRAALEAVGLEEDRGNLAIVRRSFEQMGSDDRELWDRDVEIINAEGWALESVYRGHEGLQRWWEDLAEVFEDFRIVLEEIQEVDEERVLTTQRFIGRFRATRLPFDGPWASILWVRDGKIVRAQGFLSKRRAMRAAGMPTEERSNPGRQPD
jgi:ketosteroid isomerase-like protein